MLANSRFVSCPGCGWAVSQHQTGFVVHKSQLDKPFETVPSVIQTYLTMCVTRSLLHGYALRTYVPYTGALSRFMVPTSVAATGQLWHEPCWEHVQQTLHEERIRKVLSKVACQVARIHGLCQN